MAVAPPPAPAETTEAPIVRAAAPPAASMWRFFRDPDASLLACVRSAPHPGVVLYDLHAEVPFRLALCEAHGETPTECWAPLVEAPIPIALDLAAGSLTLADRHLALAPTSLETAVVEAWRLTSPFEFWSGPDASQRIAFATDAAALASGLAGQDLAPWTLARELDAYRDALLDACTEAPCDASGRAAAIESARSTPHAPFASEAGTRVALPYDPAHPAGVYLASPVLPGSRDVDVLVIEVASGDDGMSMTVGGNGGGGEVYPFTSFDRVDAPGERRLIGRVVDGELRMRAVGERWDDLESIPLPDAPATELTLTHVDALALAGPDVWISSPLDRYRSMRPSVDANGARIVEITRRALVAIGVDPGTLTTVSAEREVAHAFGALLDVCGALPFPDEPVDALGEHGGCSEAELDAIAASALGVYHGTRTLADHQSAWGARAAAAAARRAPASE